MKKLLSLGLCFILLFSFAACGGEKEKKARDKVDLEYYAKLGQIPEVPYLLGNDCDKTEKELSNEYEDYLSNDPHESPDDHHDHYAEDLYFEVVNEGEYTFINSGNKYYFYKNNAKKDGISYIVTFGDAFGFKMGTFIYDLKKALPNIEFSEEEIVEGSLFFDEYLSGGSTLEVEFDGITVMFVFLEGELYATAMFKTNSWK